MVDLGSLVLLMSIFGWKVAVLYVVFGLVIAVIGGTLIEKLHLDDEVENTSEMVILLIFRRRNCILKTV